MSGMLVRRASSVGSVSLLSLKSTRSNEGNLSIPAKDDNRLPRKLRVAIAGIGLRTKECSDSIMQFERFRALSAVKVARLSGISVNRFEDKSRD